MTFWHHEGGPTKNWRHIKSYEVQVPLNKILCSRALITSLQTGIVWPYYRHELQSKNSFEECNSLNHSFSRALCTKNISQALPEELHH